MSKQVFWRYAYGIKLVSMGKPDGKTDVLSHPIPVHGEYYGAIIYYWDDEKDRRVEPILQELLIEAIEQFVGYTRDKWVNPETGQVWIVIDDGWGWQEFTVDDFPDVGRFLGRYEWRIEKDDGSAEASGEGRL